MGIFSPPTLIERATMKELHGKLIGKGKKVAIIVSRFNEMITGKLLSGAVDCLVRHDVSDSDITVAWVPGAFELPQVAKKLSASGKYHGIIALGCVIRGSTPHFDYVAGSTARGLASVALDGAIPLAFGVLTTDTLEQALERAGVKSGNKGWDAALTTLEMMSLSEQLA
jgi:6,7-dimethyl-8-ribityllumazine synthase